MDQIIIALIVGLPAIIAAIQAYKCRQETTSLRANIIEKQAIEVAALLEKHAEKVAANLIKLAEEVLAKKTKQEQEDKS